MNAALERLNHEADRIDQAARRDIARRAKAASALRARSAPYRAIFDLEQVPEPLPVAGLSVLACAVLALVQHFERLGFAALQAARKDLAWLFSCSDSSVRRALADLSRGGWLIVTPDYVPAEETALGGRYVTGSGRFRSVLSDDDDAYAQSRVRNLLQLGTKARAAGLAKACGKVVEFPGEPAGEPATCSALFSVSGDPDRSASLLSPRACGLVENPAVSGDGIEGSAPSARSTFAPPERDGVSEPSAARLDERDAPLVADARLELSELGDGDGTEAVSKESPRRGLFGSMGWRVARFFGGAGGDS